MFSTSVAYAMGAGAEAGAQGGNPIMSFVPLILMFAIFYFMLIRPQQKKAKEHREMLGNLKKGDRVITGGGLYGRIVEVSDEWLSVDLGQTVVKVGRGFISGLADPKNGKKEEPAKDSKK
ncbi:preprotein translocase subunit YajC [Oleidesulfovibrio alaskensis]|jgi:preprotein translocase subunit YajC|uniref:preprotein translocase subunit YajC n=1 Tax=Oleidesulfovibrio alaskensis TaxID=58180 RepID=UPI000418A1A2|nr:preprotein translocase subunit YajC [Oleidesulfovibrio alaskensis]MBG0773903.1 preprotein translocase subunit YajC [Oleidesulfovibrio alaskensis]MBL3581627.1 preprotein translocase subunit YajC [Oleidesulfovibrio alaskensis]MBL3588106.1 preprotein translocase subunit YajC [bacterium]